MNNGRSMSMALAAERLKNISPARHDRGWWVKAINLCKMQCSGLGRRFCASYVKERCI